jgi:hypothetical protein
MLNINANHGLFSPSVARFSIAIRSAQASGIEYLPAGTYVMNRSAAKAEMRSAIRQTSGRWNGKCDPTAFKARLAIHAASRRDETSAHIDGMIAAAKARAERERKNEIARAKRAAKKAA